MTSPIRRSSVRTGPKGVLAPPAGMTRGTAWLLSAVLVLVAGGVLFLLRGDLTFDGRELMADFSAAVDRQPPSESTAERALPTTPPAPTPEVAIPKAPTWSLVQVGEAVQAVAPSLQGLIAEGRDEVREFSDLTSSNTTKSDRAKRQWAAWGQIWQNRVGVVEKALPPTEACAVHASMEPACETLRGIVRTLRSVSKGGGVEPALEQLNQAEQTLDLFLNPPEPELLPETGADAEEEESTGG